MVFLGMRFGQRRLNLYSLGVILFAIMCTASRADEPSSPAAEIQRLLKINDFAAAFERATELNDEEQRDGALHKIALARSLAGEHVEAVGTAAYLSNDRLRDRVMREVVQRTVNSAAETDVGEKKALETEARGGGSLADFDTLIDLIKTTVEPDTWDDLGGPGAATGFPGGVHVDTSGLLKRRDPTGLLDVPARELLRARTHPNDHDPQQAATLRKVSLRRLEKQLQRLAALGKPADRVMQHLAGLYQVRYVIVVQDDTVLHNDTVFRDDRGTDIGDIILVGPAGDFRTGVEGRVVNEASGWPVLHLDDLVVLLRNAFHDDGRFGCSITPRKANLASAQAYLSETSDTPLKPSQRDSWLDALRERLGEQDIIVNGIDPGSRAARVLVEADYRMKLVGMGLEEGGSNVKSYLDRVELGPDGSLPPLTVLRWWFALHDDPIHVSADRDVFELPEQSVQVLSENELLTRTGNRVHTGQSDELNRAFARDFTRHFTELAAAYPAYAELRNVFDLALVAAILKSEEMPARIGWQMTYFTSPTPENWLAYRPRLRPAPQTVETVINHRVIKRRHIVAGVSGGVSFDSVQLVGRHVRQHDDTKSLRNLQQAIVPPDVWWWD
jgi:hypothetical protein